MPEYATLREFLGTETKGRITPFPTVQHLPGDLGRTIESTLGELAGLRGVVDTMLQRAGIDIQKSDDSFGYIPQGELPLSEISGYYRRRGYTEKEGGDLTFVKGDETIMVNITPDFMGGYWVTEMKRLKTGHSTPRKADITIEIVTRGPSLEPSDN